MELEVGNAVAAGLIGTGAMTAAMYIGHAMNMRMDIPMMLGTMFLPRGGAAWAVGMMMHLMMGAMFFVVYAALFDALAIQNAVVAWAVLFGLAHGVTAGLSMAMVPLLHPRMATAGGPHSGDLIQRPGIFALNMGAAGPLALLALHTLFGLTAGIVYSA